MEQVCGRKSCFAIRLILSLLVFVTLLGISSANCQDTGTISGTVTDAVTDLPIEGAVVYPGTSPILENKFATTDVNGDYVITGLSPGEYEVYAYSPDTNYIREYYKNALEILDADPVTVTAGADTPNIDFELDLGGVISGTVTDSEGVGIEGASVTALIDCQSPISSTETDASGEYIIRGIPAGSVYLHSIHMSIVFGEDGFPRVEISYGPEWYDDVASCQEATPVIVNINEETESINFQLEPGGTISGTIYDSDGVTTVAIMAVNIFSDPCDEIPIAGAFTDASGAYFISDVYPGDVYVKAFTVEDDELPFPLQEDQGPATGYLTEWYDDALSCEEADAVTITSDFETTGIDFLLASDTDTDADGMPDAWETAYFGDLSRDGSGDFDEDGSTDLEEYQAGTNPDDEIPEDIIDDGDIDGGGGGGGGGCFMSNLF